MRVAIHQPHYFPWVGYFDKMAKVDAFVLLDQVQWEKGSPMTRNRVLDNNGAVKYITISGSTKDFLTREFKALETKNIQEWTSRQCNALTNYYRKADGAQELLPIMEAYYGQNYATICEWVCASIDLVRQLLGITTPLLLQSQMNYDKTCKKSGLVHAICHALNANIYFSGCGGSVEYLEREPFERDNISIVFQNFRHPEYVQMNTNEFIPGISILDMLFNCGIEKSREIFWNNVKSTNALEERCHAKDRPHDERAQQQRCTDIL